MKIILFTFLALNLISCKKESPPTPEVTKASADELTLYTMGRMLGTSLVRLDLTDEETKQIVKGLSDVLNKQNTQFDESSYQANVGKMFQERMKKVAEKERTSGSDYMAQFLKESNVIKSPSGLAYKVLKEGNGKKVNPNSVVEVHYHGILADGTVFDSSVQRGKPLSFSVTKVMKGWTDMLTLMKEGEKVKVVIPPELAYGESGSPPKIAGGATLIFELELLRVVDDSSPKTTQK